MADINGPLNNFGASVKGVKIKRSLFLCFSRVFLFSGGYSVVLISFCTFGVVFSYFVSLYNLFVSDQKKKSIADNETKVVEKPPLMCINLFPV